MDRVNVGGLGIAFRRAGTGPPLLLLHGAFSDHREWGRQWDAFTAEFTVLAWDAPGCGESDDLPNEPFGLDRWADTLAGFLQVLNVDQTHVLGLSLGSVLALGLHDRHPACTRSLVLASAYAGWAGLLSQVQQRIRQTLRDLERPPEDVPRDLVATLFPPDAPPVLVDEQILIITRARPQTTRAMIRDLGPVDLRPALPRLTVPTLLLYGDADVRAPLPGLGGAACRDPGLAARPATSARPLWSPAGTRAVE